MGSPFGGPAVSLLPQAASANAAAVVMMNVLMRIGNPSVWDVGLFLKSRQFGSTVHMILQNAVDEE